MTDSQPTTRMSAEPCRFYAQANCRFGGKCKFSHSVEQGRMTQSSQVALSVDKGSSTEQSIDASSAQSTPSATATTEGAPRAGPGVKTKPCWAWKAGSCHKGSKCWFAHDLDVRVLSDKAKGKAKEISTGSLSIDETVQDNSLGEPRSRGTHLTNRPCRAWKAGSCSWGDNCRFIHDNESHASDEAECAKAREHEAAASRTRAIALAKEEATKTITRIVSGSIVTFNAGLNISGLIPSFESCVLHVKNLPNNVTEGEIKELLTRQGMEVDRFHVVNIKAFGNKLEARIITDAEAGRNLATNLDEIEFKDETVTIEMSTNNTIGGMSASTWPDANTLTISWRAPSVRYIAEYLDIPAANAKVRELNNTICAGRRVKVEMNTHPPGVPLKNFRPNSIRINNLPSSITNEEVLAFSGSSHVQQLRTKTTFGLGGIPDTLRNEIERFCAGALEQFEKPSAMPNDQGIFTARARFSSWEDANTAQTLLKARYSNSGLWLRLPEPMHYTITIPVEQYNAQKAQWNGLLGAIKDRKACMMNVHEQDHCVRIRLAGSVKDAVGALKVRVENLARGEKVEGWHRSLRNPVNEFFRRAFVETGAYLRSDGKRQLLKVFGSPKAIEDARELTKRELTRLASLDHTVTLPPSSVSFFLREGVSQLKETFGEDKVRFDVASRKVTITGGEDAWHALDRLIEASLKGNQALPDASDGQQACPICYDNVSSPFQLGCGHVYCVACLRHFLMSALDSDQFPLSCLGDENRCGVAIAIPTIQRFLPPASFNNLLEAAFDAYVAKHPEELKFCKTPDCTQLYRSTRSGMSAPAQCPSCFTTICRSCGEETHEGLGCEESRRLKDPGEQERIQDAWIASQGGRVRRCPQCRVPIEKLDGCNHMSCRCGAHICWRCMGIFPRETIYEHMHSVHQNIYGDDPGPGPANRNDVPFRVFGELVDIEEQRELLRQAEIQRRARQAREDAEARARQPFLFARPEEERRRHELMLLREENNRRVELARHEQRERLQVEQREERGGWGCTIM